MPGVIFRFSGHVVNVVIEAKISNCDITSYLHTMTLSWGKFDISHLDGSNWFCVGVCIVGGGGIYENIMNMANGMSSSASTVKLSFPPPLSLSLSPSLSVSLSVSLCLCIALNPCCHISLFLPHLLFSVSLLPCPPSYPFPTPSSLPISVPFVASPSPLSIPVRTRLIHFPRLY